MNEPGKRNLIIGLVAVVAILGITVAVVLFGGDKDSGLGGGFSALPTGTDTPSSDGPTTATDPNLPKPPDEPIALNVPASPTLFAGVVVELYAPGKVLGALDKNPWLAEATKTPLGRGFLGSWAGFFNARGGDLGGAFQGTLLDVVRQQLLSAPGRILWMGSDRRRSTPVLVVPNPSAAATTAFATLHRVAGRGEFFATRCPGAEEETRVDIHRVVIADRAVYGTNHGSNLVFGRHPNAVLHGACLELEPMQTPEGVDFEVVVKSDRFDRGVQSLLLFAGVSTSPRVAFAVQNDQFIPRGLRAQVSASRMPPTNLDKQMLGAIPAWTPVMLALSIQLPEVLSVDSLKAALQKKTEGGIARQAAVLWWPSGSDVGRPESFAVVWSRLEDEAALKKIFSGAQVQRACGTLVIGRTEGIEWVREACSDRVPSLAHAAPEVKAGLQKKSSVTLGVDFGRLTNLLILDAWDGEHRRDGKGARPKSVEAAAKTLEALPFFGFTGTVDGARLVPGGFRS